MPKPMADQWPPIPGARRRVCGCTTPTPDPASPCGHKRYRSDLPCGAIADDDWHDRRTWEQDRGLWHGYQATRCATCGHAIEPVKEETHA